MTMAFPADHPSRKIKPVPVDMRDAAALAARFERFHRAVGGRGRVGLRLCRAYRAGDGDPGDARLPGAIPCPRPAIAEPYAILTVSVTVGETEEHAADLTLINKLFLLRLRTGQLGQYPTSGRGAAYQFSEHELALIASMPLNFISGTAEQVAAEVNELADASGADEIMITTTLPGADDRRRTLKAMAEQLLPLATTSR